MEKRIKIYFILSLLLFFRGEGLVCAAVSLADVEALMLKDAYNQAAGKCKDILAGNSRRTIKAKAHYLRGLCLLKLGEYVQAREHFETILRCFANSGFGDEASLSIADSYLLAQEYPEAEKRYAEFLQRFSTSELVPFAHKQLEFCKKTVPVADSYFSVQLGCFNNKINAEKLRDKLANLGFEAYILELYTNNLYYVRVGRLATKIEAESLEQRLKNEGYATKICP